MTSVFQCTGCNRGPCTLTRPATADNDIGYGCPDDGAFTKKNTAVWRRLEVMVD